VHLNLNGIELYHGDCLKLMQFIPDQSVDLVLADPPYEITACEYDSIIPLEPLWEQIKRIIKTNSAVVMTACQPFTSQLVTSNLGWFKEELIYEKTNPKNYFNAKRQHLCAHENIIVFSNGTYTYNPQKWTIPEYLRTKRKALTEKPVGECYGGGKIKRKPDDGSRYPTTVIGFSNRVGRDKNYHPNQKPVELMEYLVKTYSNKGELVLDFAAGSGTTGVACKNLNRWFIGIEIIEKYFDIAQWRLKEE